MWNVLDIWRIKRTHWPYRRVHDGWPGVRLEVGGPGAGGHQFESAALPPGNVRNGHVQQRDQHGRIFLLEGQPQVQAWFLLLRHPDLHTVLYADHRVLVLLLAGRLRLTGPCHARHHHLPDHGNTDEQHQRFPATCLVHQGKNRGRSQVNPLCGKASGRLPVKRKICIIFFLESWPSRLRKYRVGAGSDSPFPFCEFSKWAARTGARVRGRWITGSFRTLPSRIS